MKKLNILFVALFLLLTISLDFAFAQRQNSTRSSSRSASGSSRSSSRSASGSSRSSGGTKSQSSSSNKSKSYSSRGGTTSKSSKRDKEDEEEEEEMTQEDQCLVNKIPELLGGDCKFLADENIQPFLGEGPFYCLFNSKDSGKTQSVYNYYMKAYYGTSEGAVKSSTTLIKIKDSAKNALKYYEYLMEEIEKGTLMESKILDNIREDLLDNSSMSIDDQSLIEDKEVEEVELAIPFVKDNIEACSKATRKVLLDCGAIGDRDIKAKITSNCTNYGGTLMRLAGEKKVEAMGYESELINVLKQRISSGVENQKEAAAREVDKHAFAIDEKRGIRATKAVEVLELKSKIDGMEDGDSKTRQKARLDALNAELCDIDKFIGQADRTYTIPDYLGCPENQMKEKEEEEDTPPPAT